VKEEITKLRVNFGKDRRHIHLLSVSPFLGLNLHESNRDKRAVNKSKRIQRGFALVFHDQR